MKKILFSGLLVACSLSSYAAETSDRYSDNSCTPFKDIASSIMKQKQEGIAQTKLIEANNNRFKGKQDEDMHQLTDYIIRDAYRQPVASSASSKELQLSQFSNKYYLSCMEKLD